MAGYDSRLTAWLTKHSITILPYNQDKKTENEIILVTEKAPDSSVMIQLTTRMAEGSYVIFMDPSTLQSGKNSTRWIPLVNKGVITRMDQVAGYYRADRWTKDHPVFKGMPSGGIMDYKYFRNLISGLALSGQYAVVAENGFSYRNAHTPLTYPDETICGATRLSMTYCSGVHIGVWDFFNGHFMVNTLNITGNLGKDPAADKLFLNMLDYASASMRKPVKKLPGNFQKHLAEIGFVEH